MSFSQLALLVPVVEPASPHSRRLAFDFDEEKRQASEIFFKWGVVIFLIRKIISILTEAYKLKERLK